MEINPKKRIEMEYYNLEDGILDFYITTNYTNRNKRISLAFWNTWDNFDEFIEWMENVLKGNNCIYEHRPEDVPFYFKYHNGYFYVYTWQDPIIDYLIEIEVDNINLIYELYYSFRNYINSEKYNYKLWEDVIFKDYLEIKYGTINDALTVLLKMNHHEIIDLLNECSKGYDDDIYSYNDFDEIVNMNEKERVDFFENCLFNECVNWEDGLILRKLKSSFIEEFFDKRT